MTAKSINGKSVEEIEKATNHFLDSGFSPTLAIIFVSINQNREKLCDFFNALGIDVYGVTSSGEFTDANESKGGISVLLLDMHKDYYQIIFEPIKDDAVKEAILTLRSKIKFDNSGLILCSTLFTQDGKMLDGEKLIENIEKVMGDEVIMFGGMAGDDFTFSGSYVFTNDQITDYGLICLELDGAKISCHGMAISGWQPIGISRIITRSEDNLIFTIDNEPALGIYLKYLGEEIDDEKDQINFFESLGIYYPLQIERENRESKMCNPIGYNKEKAALICETRVLQGSRFRFSAPPEFDIVETIIEKAEKMKIHTKSDADALLIFSCAGRLSALGPLATEENNGLSRVWNAPMAGYYTYGEFGKGENGKHEFHSTTNSWVAIKEK